MKTRSVVLLLVLCLIGLGVAFAAENPHMGTWKLNEAKSKIPPGAVKISTTVFAAEGDNVKITNDGTDSDGKSIHQEWIGKFDGKDYPATGDPNVDSRSYTPVNARTLVAEAKKGGKIVAKWKIVVAKDGKSRTLSGSGKDDSGKKVTSTAVYDKQ
jgi:hypothetical protein